MALVVVLLMCGGDRRAWCLCGSEWGKAWDAGVIPGSCLLEMEEGRRIWVGGQGWHGL